MLKKTVLQLEQPTRRLKIKLMRLLSYSLLFCFCMNNTLFAQPNDQEWKEDEQSERRRALRLGVHFQRDQLVYENYVWDANKLVPTFRRTAMWSGYFNWQALAHKEAFFVLLEGSYLSDKLELNEDDELLFRNQNNISISPFEEKIDYQRLRLAVGIQIEPFDDYRLSPYFTGKFLLIVPTHLNYIYNVQDNSFNSNPLKTTINGGAKIMPAWEIVAGFRSYLSNKVILSLGIYYQEIDQKTVWPELSYRAYGDTIFRFDRSGFTASLAYEW